MYGLGLVDIAASPNRNLLHPFFILNPLDGVWHLANLFLFLRLEHAQDATDGLAGVNGVQGAQDQMACFGRAQRNFDRLAVAHFTNQNDLRRLAQGGSQTVGEAIEIGA